MCLGSRRVTQLSELKDYPRLLWSTREFVYISLFPLSCASVRAAGMGSVLGESLAGAPCAIERGAVAAETQMTGIGARERAPISRRLRSC